MNTKALTTSMTGFLMVLSTACGGSGAGQKADGATDGVTTQGTGGRDGGAADGGTGGGGSDGGSGGTTGAPADPCSQQTFDNVLDEAMCPFIGDEGVSLTPADSVELCRRAYIDLLGSSPTAVEYESDCKGRDAGDLVDDFMSRDEYVLMSQRMWADVFHMNSALTYYQYIADLDDLTGQLHRGEISLSDFVEVSATHPGFLGRWDGLDLVGFNFLAHLGRDANSAERMELEPLWHMWDERDMNDPYQSNTWRVVLDTRRCVAPNQAECYSDFWGSHTLIIDPPAPGDMDPNGANVLDQASLTDAQWDQLRLPGRLLGQQGGVAEAYVDQAIQRYLGYDLGTLAPPAREALVELLANSNGDVRAVDREILTSSIYLATNTYQEKEKDKPENFDPPYWHGPVKQMDAETWLASSQKLVGLPVGSCDRRYPEVQSGPQGFHPNEYPTTDGSTPDYSFRDKARLLGGCPDRLQLFRETRAGLIAALTQATLTKDLCEAATSTSQIYPAQFVSNPDDKSVDALSTAADQVYRAALIKPIADDASDALQAGVQGCRDTTECLPTDFAYHTCRLVLKSADFLFY